MKNVTRARIIKTLCWLLDPAKVRAHLIKDINRLSKEAKARKMKPLVRLNGTSDIIIEKAFKEVLSQFSEVQFYDYTKNPHRKKLPQNYHLTFSFDGKNKAQSLEQLKIGRNVAVVFKDKLPKSFWGYPVINGDDSDVRPLDPQGILFLNFSAKGYTATGYELDGDWRFELYYRKKFIDHSDGDIETGRKMIKRKIEVTK